jgi:hypothetical protein
LKKLWFLGLVLLPLGTWAGEVTLPYLGTNQWVAEADNAPLRQLLGAAKRGSSNFTVVLPKAERRLSQARLEVLITLLGKQHGQAITLTEARGQTPANTLKVRW